MRKILISINPEHVRKILSGEKKYEYRTKVAKKDAEWLLIYETAPTKRIVAEAKILEVLELPPEELWAKPKCNRVLQKRSLTNTSKVGTLHMPTI